MSLNRMSDEDFNSQATALVDKIIVASKSKAGIADIIETYKKTLTTEQLHKVLLDAVDKNIDPQDICKCIVDLHDEELYISLLEETYGLIFEGIPTEDLTHEICLTAVSNNGMLLAAVPKEMIDENIAYAAVAVNGSALQFVPHDLITEKIAITALADWRAAEYIPKRYHTDKVMNIAIKSNSGIINLVDPASRTVGMYKTAVCNNPDFVSEVPDKFYFYDLCKEAILRKPDTLRVIKRHLLKDEDYLRLVNLALFTKPEVLSLMPEDFITPQERDELFNTELCQTLVSTNGINLTIIPRKERNREICLLAVENNPLALSGFNWELFSDEELPAIINKAVSENPMALEFVPEKFKKQCIETVTINQILTNNYRAYQFLTNEFLEDAARYFANVKHIAIYSPNDHELHDIYQVYANSGSREGAIACADLEHHDELLTLLEYHGVTNLHLVLIGHATKTGNDIGGIKYEEITALLKAHENIDRVTLMGCNTVKSQALDEELQIIERFKLERATASKCAFAVISVPPDYPQQILAASKQNAVYVLEYKKNSDNPPLLHYFKWKDKAAQTFTSHTYQLNETGLSILSNCLISGGKGFKSPPGKTVTYLRGGKTSPLNIHELRVVQDACHNRERTDKKSYAYKSYKKIAVFLATITIEGDEILKLKDSLLRKLITSISNSDINRNITVKGYTHGLFVDTLERRLHVTKSSIYHSDYDNTMFASRMDNIDRAKLHMERSSMTGRMLGKNKDKKDVKEAEGTQAKSIKVTVRKK